MKTRKEKIVELAVDLVRQSIHEAHDKPQHTPKAGGQTEGQPTPGPWKVYEKWVVLDNTGRTVAEAVGQLDLEERHANARLIASSPELLEALKEAQKVIAVARTYFPKSIKHTDTFSLENTCAAIGSAILKAEGK